MRTSITECAHLSTVPQIKPETFVTNRRKALATAIGGFYLCEVSAWALSPPADNVAAADLICVGTIKGFVFRGVNPLILPNEYKQEFTEDNGIGNRVLEALVQVNRILKNDLDFEIPKVIRVLHPVSNEYRQSYLGVEKIFFLKKGIIVNKKDAAIHLFKSITGFPGSIQDEENIRKDILNHKPINRR